MIDLHSHSTFSDGSETPERVVELAAEAGCEAVALTDHDGLDGLARAGGRAAELGISLVPGCEVSCAFEPGTMHLLCYYIPAGPGPLQDKLRKLRRDRDERNLEMVTRLNSLGLDIDYADVCATAGGEVVGRPHFAAVLVTAGAASSIADAFDRYLAKGAPGYVEKDRVEPAEIIEAARGSGGVAVLAHPLSLGLDEAELDRELGTLADAGLGGLESYYGRYDPETRARLVGLARRHGLVPTGGSDFHGSYKPGLSMGTGLGDLEVPSEVLAELAAQRS